MATNPDRNHPHAALIAGGLYAYGDTKAEAIFNFRRQICGGTLAMQQWLGDRVCLRQLTDEEASETAECIDSSAISWL